MKTYLYVITLIILTTDCSNNSFKKNISESSNKIDLETKITISYTEYLTDFNNKRKVFISNNNTDSISELLFNAINTSMPEYWRGTKWDFNGTTRIPKKGTIACGYFITNTLDDLKIPVERVRLAQEPSSKLIKALTKNIIRTGDFNTLQAYLNKQNEKTVFIIGLDFHTGFITKDKTNCYFIHSNYINKEGVTKELINDSKALISSKSFMIGNLSENEFLFLAQQNR